MEVILKYMKLLVKTDKDFPKRCEFCHIYDNKIIKQSI